METPPAALVLAAGFGTRLRPLTERRPKALCPVGNVALVDLAVARVRPLVPAGRIAVNVHHHADQLLPHLQDLDVHASVEWPAPLGTAGAVGRLHSWLDGAPVMVVNSDAWSRLPLRPLLDAWDGRTVRILGFDRPGDLGSSTFAGASLIPADAAAALRAEPSGLYEVLWRAALADGSAEVVTVEGGFIDCGTPERYLTANLAAAAEAGGSIVDATASVDDGAVIEGSVVGAGAVVGNGASVIRSVVWDGGVVAPGERLVDSIRVDHDLTVTP